MLYELMKNDPSCRPSRSRRPKGNHHANHVKSGLCNISENENEWMIDLLVPGYTKSDFTMDVNDGVLKVKGTKTNEEKNFIKREFRTHKVSRNFTIPKNTNVEKITAKLEAGILNIVIPKSEEAKPKTININ